MDLRTYIQSLQAHLSACSPDLGDEDAILGVLYEAYSESNAMYNDEIKSAFHTLYEAMNGINQKSYQRIIGRLYMYAFPQL